MDEDLYRSQQEQWLEDAEHAGLAYMQQLHEEWLADEAAQTEYRSWLDLLNHEKRKDDESWDVTHLIQAAATSRRRRQART